MLSTTRRGGKTLLTGAALVAVSLAIGPSAARSESKAASVTISMLAGNNAQPAFDVLIPNFERVYPNIKVEATYGQLTQLYQLETTELAAGNGPDLLQVQPGCGQPNAICVLAKAGYLAPMVNKPWFKRSLPDVLALGKYGQRVYSTALSLSAFGVWTNDDLFKKLGLKIPRTLPQLLGVCRKAKSAGTVALMLSGAAPNSMAVLVLTLAVATVYGKNTHWAADLRAGSVTFDGSRGWHRALQQLIDLNNAGCFQPGAAGTIDSNTQFAQGQALMLPAGTQQKGLIDATDPTFRFSHHVYPAGTDPTQTTTQLIVNGNISVNAHSSPEAQQAAQKFVDFIERPAQDALFAKIEGGLTQQQFLNAQIPSFMSDFKPVFAQHHYAVSPAYRFWNANVTLALQQNAIGLITGQRSIDEVLKAMDAAWKQGPQ